MVGIDADRLEVVADRRAVIALGLFQAAAPVRGLDRGATGGELGLVQPVRGAVRAPPHQIGGGEVERGARGLVAPCGVGRQQLEDLERGPLAAGAPLDAHRRHQPGAGELAGRLGEIGATVALARRSPFSLQLVTTPLLIERSTAVVGPTGAGGQVAETDRGLLELTGPEARPQEQIQRVEVCALLEVAREVLDRDREMLGRGLEVAVMVEARAQDARRVGIERDTGQPQQPSRGETRGEIGAVLAQELEQRVGAVAIAGRRAAVEPVEHETAPGRRRQLLQREVLEHAAIATLLERADEEPLAVLEERRRRIVLEQRDQQPRRELGMAELALQVRDPQQRVGPQRRLCAHHAGVGADRVARVAERLEQVGGQVLDAERARRVGLGRRACARRASTPRACGRPAGA